jgi:hypothetical protein
MELHKTMSRVCVDLVATNTHFTLTDSLFKLLDFLLKNNDCNIFIFHLY